MLKYVKNLKHYIKFNNFAVIIKNLINYNLNYKFY